MRKKVMAANWKMNKTPDQTREFFRDFLPMVSAHDRDEIVICPPFLDIDAAITSAKGSGIAIGTQDVYWQTEGAYTGETDDIVNLKLKAALEAGLTPIVCVGEVLEEREAGLTEDVLRRQCLRAFHAISGKKASKLIVAYEPVWAIGTGKTATPQMAADAHALIRTEVGKALGQELAESLRVPRRRTEPSPPRSYAQPSLPQGQLAADSRLQDAVGAALAGSVAVGYTASARCTMLGSSPVVTFLLTRDKAKAKAFYADVLGLRFLWDDGFALVFDTKGIMLRIVEMKDWTPQKGTTLGWEVADISAAARGLSERGVHFERFGMPQDELGIWTAPTGDQVAWFKDPDGNLLSLSQHVAK